MACFVERVRVNSLKIVGGDTKMADVVRIGELSVEPGTKKYGSIEVALRPDGSPIYIPLMIVNGVEEGAVLNISSGCHGDEYEGGEAIRRTWRSLDPEALKGVFLGVPVINVLAFESGTRTSWIDHLNLNRVFPGNPDGFITEKLAHVYLNEVVSKADLVVDLHGGGNIMIMGNQVIYRDTPGEAEVIEKELELAKATGFEYIWKGSGGWGGTITVEALKKGIPAVTAEAGGEGRCLEPIVKDFERLISNVMKAFNMMEGKPQLPSKWVMFQGGFINTRRGGFWTQAVGLKERVKEGQTLGTVIDLFGEVVETIKAPFDGIVCSKRTFPVVQPGDWTVQVGRIVEE